MQTSYVRAPDLQVRICRARVDDFHVQSPNLLAASARGATGFSTVIASPPPRKKVGANQELPETERHWSS